jgi:hypothetical protein
MVTGVGAVVRGDVSAVGATAAEAPPAIANDIPAAPQAGKAILERFLLEARFACAISSPPLLLPSKHTAIDGKRNTTRYHASWFLQRDSAPMSFRQHCEEQQAAEPPDGL